MISTKKYNFLPNKNYSYTEGQFEILRIGIALFSIFNFLLFCVDYNFFLAPDGIVSWEVSNASTFWFEPHLLKISSFLAVSELAVLNVSITLYLASLILLALGVYPRLAAISSLSFFLIFSSQLYPFLYGVELYQNVLLLFLCIFPSGYKYSLQSLKLNDSIIDIQRIGIRTIQLYLGLTYLSAGLGKAQMKSWLNGEFLFLSLSDPTYQFFLFPTDLPIQVYTCLGILVVALEACYILLVLIPMVRSILILSIVGMHIFIAFFMGLFPFGMLLALVNIIVWYPILFEDFYRLKKITFIQVPAFAIRQID